MAWPAQSDEVEYSVSVLYKPDSAKELAWPYAR
ncbi:MAG: hypothetical protein JWM91_2823 [Rhodospirillales bacterium]|nr:hypothetical protein [Rhodospirillales bacterium]